MSTKTGLKKERETLEEAAARLLSATLAAGAEDAEVCAGFGQRTKIALEKQDFHLASTDEGYQLGVRALRGGRQGFASCNTTDPRELKEIALRAVEIAGFSPPNPYNEIAAGEGIPAEAPEAPWDERLFQASMQTQKDWTRLMIEEATRDARFRVNEGTLGTSAGLSLVVNSKGTRQWERDCNMHWSLMGMAIEGDAITSFDYFSEISRVFDPTPDRIRATARAFADNVIQGLGAGAAKSYKGLVVFSPRAVCEILLSTLAYHLNGRVLAEKTGRWQTGDHGKAVLDRRLTVRDLPWLPDRTGFGRFDREGTPTRNRTLVDKGCLAGWLLDRYSAKALGLATTGNAAGGATAPPTVGAHNLVLAAGDEPLAGLLARLGRQRAEFLVVHRYSGQTDPVTGEFSGVAKGGEWWHGGERRHCVKETLISGNLFEVLRDGVYGLSRETQVVDSGEESPTVVLDGISVTSG
jgi:PmbA protein